MHFWLEFALSAVLFSSARAAGSGLLPPVLALAPTPRGEDALAAVRAETLSILGKPLDAQAAVRLAFLNSAELHSRLEDLGVARAEMLQAGLLENPTVHFALRFPSGGGAFATGRELGAAEDFLSLVSLPLRRRLAQGRYEEARLRLGQEVMGFSARVERGFYEAQAAQARLKALEDAFETLTAAGMLASGQRAAGNISRLDEIRRQEARREAELDLSRERAADAIARDRLTLLMGVQDARAWTLAPAQAPPAQDPPLALLEETALSRRWDLAAARREPALLGQALSLNRLRAIGGLSVGYDSEKDLDGKFGQGPAIEWSVPLFDRRQDRRKALRARSRRAEASLAALGDRVRFEVRSSYAELTAARARVEIYDRDLLPLRASAMDESLKRYDFMLLGVYQLLEARRELLTDEVGRIDAARDYWMAVASLELATGGPLPPSPSAPAQGGAR